MGAVAHERFVIGLRLAAMGLVLALLLASPLTGSAEPDGWSRPAAVSGFVRGSWFPSLAVDNNGTVHIVWSVSGEPGGELLFYTRWDGKAWTRPVDIGIGGDNIARSALAVDSTGMAHLVYNIQQTVSYTNTRVDQAWIARSWAAPHGISRKGNGYLEDVAVDDRGVVHVVWNEGSGVCGTCFDIYYQQSVDGGRSWQSSVKLTDGQTDNRKLQMKVDRQGVIHVAWDNVDYRSRNISAGYSSSYDGGKTWGEPKEFFLGKGTPAQTAVGVDNKGQAILVFRTVETDEVYYVTSPNDGKTWNKPVVLPGLWAVKTPSNFDKFEMRADSAGVIHLLAVGRVAANQAAPGLYQLRWDGKAWSKPEAIYTGPDMPEYPTLAIQGGNRLYAAWFTRGAGKAYELPDETFRVWYSTSVSSAPALTPVPIRTMTVIPSAVPTRTSTATPTLAATPTPAATPTEAALTQNFGDLGPNFPIVIALAPVVLILILVVGFRSLRRG